MLRVFYQFQTLYDDSFTIRYNLGSNENIICFYLLKIDKSNSLQNDSFKHLKVTNLSKLYLNVKGIIFN